MRTNQPIPKNAVPVYKPLKEWRDGIHPCMTCGRHSYRPTLVLDGYLCHSCLSRELECIGVEL